MTDDTDDTVTAGTSITPADLADLRDAFVDADIADITAEHGGATLSIIFDTDDGYFGVSIATGADSDDIRLSVAEWVLREHHELDAQIWDRVGE
jgi:hypothetical protein